MEKEIKVETYRMDLEFLGANSNPNITTENKSKDYIQYYNKNVLDVHNYSKITYHNVYPKIDWVIYKTEQTIKYDFIVHPGGDPSIIKLKIKWANDVKINEDGSYTLVCDFGEVKEESPVSFQEDKVILTQFKLLTDNIISFDIEEFDSTKKLRIDPTLVWATYYGGVGRQSGLSSKTDLSGNVYLTGYTRSSSAISTAGSHLATPGGDADAYLVKFDQLGVRQWATYFGGDDVDIAYSCSVDLNGNIFIVGATESTTSIALLGHQNVYSDNRDAFLAKFNTSGNLLWSTYYGDLEFEAGKTCATDANGNVYLGGKTTSTANIASGGHQNIYGGGTDDAFLVKFNANGDRLWATYYGGSLIDEGNGCTTDVIGNVYLAGNTSSTASIAFGGHQNTYGGGAFDAYLVKFNDLGVREWASYYGGTGFETGTSCATNFDGDVYLAGNSSSTLGIATNSYQNFNGGGSDAYLAKFNPVGNRQCASYYGGTEGDIATSCTVDLNGYISQCEATYTVPSGDEIYNVSGAYSDTIPNSVGCDSVMTINLVIYSTPLSDFNFTNECLYDTVNFINTSSIITPESIISWSWDIDNNGTEDYTIQNPKHKYSTAGDYDVSLIVESNNGCLDTLVQTVTLYPVPEAGFAASTVCVNGSATDFINTSSISSGSIVSFGWLFGDGNFSLQENPVNNYAIASNYNVTLGVESNLGCADTVTFSIEVLGKPTAAFTQDTTNGCAPLCVIFTDTSYGNIPIIEWSWKFENNYGESTSQMPNYCYTAVGDYDVGLIVKNAQGCKDTLEQLSLISILPLPVSEFTLNPEETDVLNSNIDFTNNSIDADTWSWNFGDNTAENIVDYNPSHIYSDSGMIEVELIVVNSFSCRDTSYQIVNILPVDELFVPSAFSPNGDGKNDVLYARGYIGVMYFVIFDRLGKKVFESEDKETGWDGLINGKKALEGVYSWYLQAEVNGKANKLKGDVTLVR